jgi:hypothetical protein
VFNENLYKQLINHPHVECTLDSAGQEVSEQEQYRDLIVYERHSLLEKLNENQVIMLNARNEYERQYENFIDIAKRFYNEKYLNLKLQFKNQILKQQIYFEQELYEMRNELEKDLKREPSRGQSKHVVKNYIRLFKMDVQKLIDYMKTSLITSYDTLIDAYDTCHVLKAIERIQTGFINTDQATMQQQQDPNTLSTNVLHDDNNDNDVVLNEQIEFIKYKQDLENLMYALDEIEVQYLNRKDELARKSKLHAKLKNKLKHIETKYESLNKNVQKLKSESFVYKELVNERHRSSCDIQQRIQHTVVHTGKSCAFEAIEDNRSDSTANDRLASNMNDDYNRKLYLITNMIDFHKKSGKDSLIKASMSRRSSSASSSSLNIYECAYDGDIVSIENRNFKSQYNIKEYSISRQIENMPMLTYKIQDELVIRPGSVSSLKTMFNDQINFLVAIKNTIDTANSAKRRMIKINTNLIEPDGRVISTHVQHVPEFYYDIFKYANLIRFFN